MNAEEVIKYILTRHHLYVKHSIPLILAHVERVALKHGDRFPYMVKVAKLFSEVTHDMTQHMEKEERILFPRIKQLEAGQHLENSALIENPISVMEAEHEHAGDLLY